MLPAGASGVPPIENEVLKEAALATSEVIPVRNGRSKSDAIASILPAKSASNIWTVMQKWVLVLPEETDVQAQRKILLQKELKKLVKELSDTSEPGPDGVSL